MTISSIELYPRIIVYKNIFKNINKTCSVLNDSVDISSNKVFSEWTQWSSFGKYLNPVSRDVDWKQKDISVDVSNVVDNKDQKNFIIELIENFKFISLDYSNRYGIDITSDGWEWTAPVICRYDHIIDQERKMTMKYHSDYIWEPICSPGTKFVITALAYFNDDYEGGEIDFAIGNKLIKYKPTAGDFLVFPSGHPEILTDEGNVYLHGVLPVISGNNKIFSRMFWKKYYPASHEWNEKEKQYGKEVWDSMQDSIMKEFRLAHPQRNNIKNGIRLA